MDTEVFVTLLAVTVPSDPTETASLPPLHVTFLLLAFSGVIVAVSFLFFPTSKESVVSLSETPVTATAAALTVTVHVAVLLPALAVIVASPTATAVTLPSLSTVAMFLLLVVQSCSCILNH